MNYVRLIFCLIFTEEGRYDGPVPTSPKKLREKGEKKTPISFRVDQTTAFRVKTIAAYYRKGLTTVVEDLIDQEYERLLKKDPAELKKSEKFV